MTWSRKITDLHERLSPNEGLARAMDLHNNEVGRYLFLRTVNKKEEIIPILIQMAEEAVKVQKAEEIQEHKYELVFIEEFGF